jgi:hypothetical protein
MPLRADKRAGLGARRRDLGAGPWEAANDNHAILRQLAPTRCAWIRAWIGVLTAT